MVSLSIIVPVYNSEKVICRAIESVIYQTFTDWELILVDDGSTDKSGHFCDAFAQSNKNIHCIHQKNKGLSAARNAGMRIARGHFLAFLDADDWIDANYYQCLISPLIEYNVDMVLGGYIREFWKDTFMKKRLYISFPEAKLNLKQNLPALFQNHYAYNLFIHVWNKIYLREIIEKHSIYFDETLRFAEDIPFNLNYYRHCKNIYLSKSCGYHYICASKTSQTTAWNADLLKYNSYTFREIRSFLLEMNPNTDYMLISDIYMRGCFLNIEKALKAKTSVKQTIEVIRETLNQKETQEILKMYSVTQHMSLEFFLYHILLKSNCSILIYCAAQMRKCIKKILGRL